MVFSDQYLLIVMLLSVVSTFWLLMTKSEVLKRYDNAASNLSDILKANYEKILMSEEIDSLVNPIVSKNKAYLHAQAKRYSRWWWGMLLIIVLSFVLGNFLFIRGGSPKQAKSTASTSSSDLKNPNEKIKNPTANPPKLIENTKKDRA